MEKVKIFFLGAGEVAVPILLRLASSSLIEFCGAATQIDKPAGRKKIMTPTPVAAIADLMGIYITKIPNVNDKDFIQSLREMDLDFIVVVSFGQFLRQEILDLPRHGCINIHTSILPKYRGASPITTAILNQEHYTGISFMDMELSMDTGAVYQCIEIPIHPNDTAGSLENRLGQMAANHVDMILLDIKNGRLNATLQDNSEATYCKKIQKQSGYFDFANNDSNAFEAMVRAYTPWPNVTMSLPLINNKEIKIVVHSCRIMHELVGEVGVAKIHEAGKNGIFINLIDGKIIEILTLTVPGKKEITAKEFTNGYHLDLERELI